MGRKSYKNANLPAHMRARARGKKTFYYYDTGGKPRREIPLGSDYALAVKKWAKLEIDKKAPKAEIVTFRYVAERYLKEVIPNKAPNTQQGNIHQLKMLYQFFDNPPAPLDKIKPINIRQYLDWRAQNGAKIAANREKALFSHIFNKAREWGYTDRENPCAGITGATEKGRKHIYIEDNVFNDLYQAASQPLRDAMDLAYLTGQRPGDILNITESDIKEGELSVIQSKTGKKLSISIEGELTAVISRIMTRKAGYKIRSLALIVDENGQKLTTRQLQWLFDKARRAIGLNHESFQFRDLRAKAGTDKAESSGDIRQAQRQLGHANITMTEHYVRNRKGDKIKPTK